MYEEHFSLNDPKIKAALTELKKMIRKKFPTATFSIYRGEDPNGVYLETRVDTDDTDQVMDLIVDRLLEMQIEENLPIFIVSLPTPEREVALREEQLRTRTSTTH